MDLSVGSNLVNIRTCADSLTALINLIKYVADDGDLKPQPEPGDRLPDILVEGAQQVSGWIH